MLWSSLGVICCTYKCLLIADGDRKGWRLLSPCDLSSNHVKSACPCASTLCLLIRCMLSRHETLKLLPNSDVKHQRICQIGGGEIFVATFFYLQALLIWWIHWFVCLGIRHQPYECLIGEIKIVRVDFVSITLIIYIVFIDSVWIL